MTKNPVIIAAISQNEVFGVDNNIPWQSKSDLVHFKKVTFGHTVIMGRNTFESLPQNFTPLPGRKNIVVTSKADNNFSTGVLSVRNLDEAVAVASTEKVFLIGGFSIWKEALEKGIVTEAYISRIPVFVQVTSETKLFSELLESNASTVPRRSLKGMTLREVVFVSDEFGGQKVEIAIEHYIK